MKSLAKIQGKRVKGDKEGVHVCHLKFRGFLNNFAISSLEYFVYALI